MTKKILLNTAIIIWFGTSLSSILTLPVEIGFALLQISNILFYLSIINITKSKDKNKEKMENRILYFCIGCRCVHYDMDFCPEDGDLEIKNWDKFMATVNEINKK